MKHPVAELAHRYGRTNALGIVGVVIVAILAALPEESNVAFFAILAGLALIATAEPFTSAPPTELEEAEHAYVEGDISLEEFESRVELILDQRAREVREVVEEVGGVGPATSAAIADEFGTVEDLERASIEELERVYGVGESTAIAVSEQLGYDGDVSVSDVDTDREVVTS